MSPLKLNFVDVTDEIEHGLSELSKHGIFEQDDDGITVRISKSTELCVEYDGFEAMIQYDEPTSFFRGISILKSKLNEVKFRVCESNCFSKNGIMLDCSRNAVMRVSRIKYFIRKMAIMGMNCMYLYFEDTICLPDEPYFGYLRGAYSYDELKEVDEYAELFGIEVIPFVQTLSHFERVLQWPTYKKYSMSFQTLDTQAEGLYDFLEKLITTASKPFRTNRICIGMDETNDIIVDESDANKKMERFLNHLNNVIKITDKYNLQAIMAGDMFFTFSFGSYYKYGYSDGEKDFLPCIHDNIPKNVQMIYWDYYNGDTEVFEKMIDKTRTLSGDLTFWSASWTWNRIAYNHKKVIESGIPGLCACKNRKVNEVILSMWGDDGSECDKLNSLYAMQIFADYGYKGEYSKEETDLLFATNCGCSADSFIRIGDFDFPQIESGNFFRSDSNISKALLYEDPLLPLFENDTKCMNLVEHYKSLSEDFANFKADDEEVKLLFKFYYEFASLLYSKCLWCSDAAAAVRSNDRYKTYELVSVMENIIVKTNSLRNVWRKLWEKGHKPFGFEPIDMRLGALQARCNTALEKIKNYSDGEINTIEELIAEKLPLLEEVNGRIIPTDSWLKSVTASIM